MQCLRSNPNAVELLGVPIIEKKVEVGNNNVTGERIMSCRSPCRYKGKIVVVIFITG